MSAFKIVVLSALVVLALVFVLQNAEEASINFLGMAGIRMPLAFLVLILLGMGFLAGWLARGLHARRAAKAARRQEKS